MTIALTRREHDVALLIAEGLTNREISRRLYLEENTVKNYVTAISQTLRVEGAYNKRVLIARWVWEHEAVENSHQGGW